MMTPQVDSFTKGRKIALCTIIAAFAAFLVVGTTWGKYGDGGGGGKAHTSPTGQCTVCHDTNLQTIHQEGCSICHTGRSRALYDYLAGASFDCLSCHDLSGTPVDYHMNMDTKHTSTEAFCMKCHSTGIFAEIPIAPLPEVHEGLGEVDHLPLTVDCLDAVAEIEDDIYCYCLECHVNPARIETLPANANCTNCHEEGWYNAKLNGCFHEDILKALEEAGIDVNAHTMCTVCHVPCTE